MCKRRRLTVPFKKQHGKRVYVQNWTTVLLLYLLTTAKAIEFENVFLSDMENLKTVFSQIHCRWQVFSS